MGKQISETCLNHHRLLALPWPLRAAQPIPTTSSLSSCPGRKPQEGHNLRAHQLDPQVTPYVSWANNQTSLALLPLLENENYKSTDLLGWL